MSRSHALRPLRRVVELSLVLPAGAVIALIWANTAAESYERVAGALHFAVNDVGMAFFFALATKEVVEATAPGGALHTWRRAAPAGRRRGRRHDRSRAHLFRGRSAARGPRRRIRRRRARDAADTLGEFERSWKHPVQFVLFMFGLVNAGVALTQVGPGTTAVLVGVLAGKPAGILAAVALALAAGLHLPSGLTWRDLVVVGFAAGIGFTVALFFATVAFPPGPLLDQTKIEALLSVSSSLAAFVAAVGLGVGRYRAAGGSVV